VINAGRSLYDEGGASSVCVYGHVICCSGQPQRRRRLDVAAFTRYSLHNLRTLFSSLGQVTCLEAQVENGRVLRELIDELLSVEKVGTVVTVNDELLLASQKAIAHCQISLFRDCYAQLLIKVAVYTVQFLPKVTYTLHTPIVGQHNNIAKILKQR